MRKEDGNEDQRIKRLKRTVPVRLRVTGYEARPPLTYGPKCGSVVVTLGLVTCDIIGLRGPAVTSDQMRCSLCGLLVIVYEQRGHFDTDTRF